ncbi:MAG: RNA 2',3'-cyclic phosphodiesterase [Gemmatimonadetes bacterium]|nr:MAG: RNA 2',3'-cyclic phosphodiesterase [Gemmatimonadota bacterium]PYP53581.1 MAG: RNA 2',3'-cyclic phosphodiesterase [Gemmatimonadota bacterium]
MPERLFIGVPLTDDARRAIVRSLPKSLPGKPVPPENWHFTLRFLGSTSTEARDQIVERLESATCGSPFTIRFSELGAFPNPKRARILWLGIDEGAERLIQLAAIAEGTARSVGFAAETKPFKPHLTLSRIDPPVTVVKLLGSKPRFRTRMTVDSVILYRSHLGGGPARYEEVVEIGLRR